MDPRRLFFQHVAQTSPSPLSIHIKKASGTRITDHSGKQYLDLIAGISVCNVGHRHPQVIRAIKKQLDAYMHVLVYGEMIENPQVEYARLLADSLPASLDCVYFTNSGAEAVEGAMKLAKRHTGRTEIICFDKSYHGSTQGALSIMGDEYWRNAFRPLLPDIIHAEYNSFEVIERITAKTACIIMETVQAERGVIVPSREWVTAIRAKCSETGTLLIMDEIQTGFGRCGSLWGFEKYGMVPDVILLGKALGGGMPLGAFIASQKIMHTLTADPVLGHITTFGGHPVCCAAGLAAMKVLLKKQLIDNVKKKEKLFHKFLQHPDIKNVRSAGLLIAVELENDFVCKSLVDYCIMKGVLTDWFLFAPNCLRIAPPLTISSKEIKHACEVIKNGLNAIRMQA